MRTYVIIALLLSCYTLPWIVNPAASLTPNAYDLAEWASLHPAVQGETPALLTPLLLRLPLVCAALLVAFTTRRSLISVAIVLVIAVALLPPEVIPFLSDNANSRQQSALAVATLIGSIAGLSGIVTPARRWIAAGIAAAGAAAALAGLAQSYALMRGFALPTQVGFGGIALVLVLGVAAVIYGVNRHKPNRAAQRLP